MSAKEVESTRIFLPEYEYYIDANHDIKINAIKDFDKFNPDLLNIGDLNEPSKPIEVLSVVFDLEGFTNFTKQVDPQLSIPNYISDFFNWLFAQIKESITDRKDKKLWSEFPFFSKFMGDGALFLWKIDLDKIMRIGKDLPSNELRETIDVFICNIIACMYDICNNYLEFYISMKEKYVQPPSRLRCGIARGNVFPIGNGLDFVGPCINISSRLQKFNGLSFAF
jgi:class 3 adenylate cyclase